MFTGLIQEIGKLKAASARPGIRLLEIEAPVLAPRLAIGDSVALNGVCQTVTGLQRRSFTVQAFGDTLTKSTLGQLSPGSWLNLEPAMRVGDRLDGHFVQGHVNAVARCLGWEGDSNPKGGRFLFLDLPKMLGNAVVAEGSIAVDGVSLTIAGIGEARSGATGLVVRISTIPHTLSNSTIGRLAPGDRVNIETDMLLRPRNKSHSTEISETQGFSLRDLSNWGYQ